MDVATKMLIAEQLARLGVDVIEAGFAIVSEGDREAISRISASISGPVICSLARTRQDDIEAAARALSGATKPRIHVFVATSDVHMEKKLRKTPAQILEMVALKVQLAKSYVGDVQFSPEDASRTGLDFLLKVVTTAIQAGATTINIPDTVGYSVGNEYSHLIDMVKGLLVSLSSGAIISTHCHNDLGLAVANTLIGVQAGARQVECCALGIGERAGNAQLEAVIMALRTRQDQFGVQIGVDATQLYKTAHLVAAVTGKPISDTLPVVGGNAFSHGAGIHQDGMKKDSSTYEIMKPEDVGWQGEATPLTKHSGRAALETRLMAIGYEAKPGMTDNIWPKFKLLADHKNYIYNDDLHLLMQECFVEQMAEQKKLIMFKRIDYHRVANSLSVILTLSLNGTDFEASGNGDGPVASIDDAMLKILASTRYHEGSVVWEGYNVSQSTGGVEATGLVSIRAKNGRGVGYGRAGDTDVIVGSAKAMVSAINHLMQTPVQEIMGDGN
jgi:2-isopropylmalate synthase